MKLLSLLIIINLNIFAIEVPVTEEISKEPVSKESVSKESVSKPKFRILSKNEKRLIKLLENKLESRLIGPKIIRIDNESVWFINHEEYIKIIIKYDFGRTGTGTTTAHYNKKLDFISIESLKERK